MTNTEIKRYTQATERTAKPSRSYISAGIFLIALTTLMVELLLLRIFDVILQDNLAYMVISCAMFAFGLSGVYATLRPPTSNWTTEYYLSNLAMLFGISIAILLPVINILPFSLDQFFTQLKLQVFYFLLLYLVLILPFFFSGLIFATAFSHYAGHIRRLYFFDLCGGAIGCVFLLPFISFIGPGGLLLVASALGLLAAALFKGTRKFTAFVMLLAVCLVATPVSLSLSGWGYLEFHEHVDKRGVSKARDQDYIEITRWDPIAKIDVIQQTKTDKLTGEEIPCSKHVAYDGGNQSSMLYPFDGDYVKLKEIIDNDILSIQDHFWNRGVLVSHYLKADTNAEVLIIGSAAGQETKAALCYNASHVTAVEMVGTVVDMVTGTYSEYIGHIFNDPRVKVHVAEGRSFLRKTKKKFDIIQIFSNHTSSSMATGNGAMATVYLQTDEAYTEYFSHLKENGVLHINHHVYPKMIVTAALSWREMGRSDFRKHVVVFQRSEQDNLPTMLIKMSPWTETELNRIKTLMLPLGVDRTDTHYLVENPLDPESSFLSNEFYSGRFPQQLYKSMDYRILPCTDDRPYFNCLRRRFELLEPNPKRFLDTSTALLLNNQLSERYHVPKDVIHFIITGLAAAFFSVIFIFLPLFVSEAGRRHWPGKLTAIFYFSCLGAGFIIVELTCIQIFMKLIGYPLYTYSTVIFTILLAAGSGSLCSNLWNINPQKRWWLPFTGILLCGVLLWLVHPYISNIFLASNIAIRLLVCAGMIFPIAFFMGMPLPIGILALKHRPAGAIAWAWGMNGFFTVTGGLAAALLSIFIGFKFTLLIAFSIYLLAFISYSRLRYYAIINTD